MSAAEPNAESLAARLATVRVDPRSELEVSRHLFNGQATYVVRDPITFQTHQLSAADYQIFVAIKSNEPLAETFQRLCTAGKLDRTREDEFYRFIVHLDQLGLLHLPVTDGSALYDRYVRRRKAERRARLLGFLFLRVPLIQPDALLSRTLRWASPLFTRTALILWLLGLVTCGCIVIARWEEFCSPLGTILATQNLPLLWALLILLKVIHEFGHAYACKHFGARVPEMGAYFIVFTPCAYVDASGSWGFPSRFQRIVVALGGMYFELIAAMLAVVVWFVTAPGTLHSVAHYAVILATIATIAFNANPLMKYDGYYVLSDLLGTPNLRSESQQQLIAFVKRAFLGVKGGPSRYSVGRRWFMMAFGLASSLYKVAIVLSISLMIAFKIPALGFAMAGFFMATSLGQLAFKVFRYITSLEDFALRRRAIGLVAATAVGLVAILAFVPVPGSRKAIGILARRHERVIHATASGFLAQSDVKVGEQVDTGQPVCKLENILVSATERQKRAELVQLRIEMQNQLRSDPRAAATTAQKIERSRREEQQARKKRESLIVRAPSSGRITEAELLRDLGRFIREGEPLATVGDGDWVVKALVTAEDLSNCLPQHGDTVSVCFVGDAGQIYRGRIIQIAEAGSRRIEAESLTHVGGGEIPVLPQTQEAERAFFEVVVLLGSGEQARLRRGSTAWIQFDGRSTPVGLYLYRRGLHVLNQLRMAG